jgi:hypothetical protein
VQPGIGTDKKIWAGATQLIIVGPVDRVMSIQQLAERGLGVSQRAQFGNLPLGGDAATDNIFQRGELGAHFIQLAAQIGHATFVAKIHHAQIAAGFVQGAPIRVDVGSEQAATIAVHGFHSLGFCCPSNVSVGLLGRNRILSCRRLAVSE